MHLQRGYVDCIESEDKNNGITIIAKSNEASEYCYIYIYICGQHGYRRQKTRELLACNQDSNVFADGDATNTVVTYEF